MFLAWKDENFINKILMTLLLTIFMVLIFASFSYGSTYYSSLIDGVFTYSLDNSIYPGKHQVTLPKDFLNYHYIFLTNDQGWFYMVCSKSLMTVTYSNDDLDFTVKTIDNSTLYYYFYARLPKDLDLSNRLIENDFIKHENGIWKFETGSSSVPLICHVIFSDFDVFDNSGSLVHTSDTKPAFTKPSFKISQEELELAKYDYLKIDKGSLTPEDKLYLHVAKVDKTLVDNADVTYYLDEKIFCLDENSSYYVNPVESSFTYYAIPRSALLSFTNDNEYVLILSSSSSSIGSLSDSDIYAKSVFTVREKTPEELNQDKQDEINETNKGIWETIKEILSYINPLSENFFVYKLIELLVDAVKSLFIPSDDFFGNYFNELKEWFSNRLGFLFYPFELLIDILSKILNINFSEPIFNIPDIKEPFTGVLFIAATTFNLNDLLSNSVLKTIHDIYLLCVDAFIIFELVNLFKRKYEGVTTK